jgi:hypothetical protein
VLGFDDASEIVERGRKKNQFPVKVVCALFKFHGGFTVLRNA